MEGRADLGPRGRGAAWRRDAARRAGGFPREPLSRGGGGLRWNGTTAAGDDRFGLVRHSGRRGLRARAASIMMRRLILASGCVAILAAAACGGNSADTGKSAAPAAPAAAAAPAAPKP